MEYFSNDLSNPILCNLRFLISIRNRIEHSYAPEIDPDIFGECQAYLMNYEEILVREFGSKFALADNLIFSLQYSRIRTDEQVSAIKKASPKSFKALKSFVDDFRSSLTGEIASDPKYSFKVFLVPKPANRASTADAALEFVKYNPEKPEEMARYQHIIGLIKEKKVEVEPKRKKTVLVKNTEQTHDRVLLVKTDNKSSDVNVSITRDSKAADGILVYPQLSEEIFNDATGFVDTALLLEGVIGEFPLSERCTYFVYADRKNAKLPNAARLFLSGSYRLSVPYYHWLTVTAQDDIVRFISHALSECTYPKVLSLFRLFVATEDEDWINYVNHLTEPILHHTQKPQWYWSFFKMLQRRKTRAPIYAATDLTPNQTFLGHRVPDLLNNIELASTLLSDLCSQYSKGNEVNKSHLRLLDLMVHYRSVGKLIPRPEK